MTYPAKEFRVHTQWSSRRLVLLASQWSSVTEILSSSAAAVARLVAAAAQTNKFEFPEDPADSMSDQSREGSVQIIDSHPRTFSVPSTDDESDSLDDDSDVEIASSVQENNGTVSAATTPDHGPAVKRTTAVDLEAEVSDNVADQGKIRGLNLQGPSINKVLLRQPPLAGLSQLVPIDLEVDGTRNRDVHDTESEDEGPEILPIQQNPAKAGSPPLRRITSFYDAQVAELERYQSPELHLESVAGATDGFDSVDEDGLDHDDDFSDFGHKENTEVPYTKPTDTLSVTQRPAAALVEADNAKNAQNAPGYQLQGKKHSFQARSTFKPVDFGVSMSDAVDVSQSNAMDYPPPVQRASSPSDAALARHPLPGPSMLNGYPGHGSLYSNPLIFPSPQGFTPAVPNHSLFGSNNLYHFQQPADQGYHSRPYNQGPFQTRDTRSEFETYGDTTYNVTYGHSKGNAPADQFRSIATANNIDDDARFAAELQAEEDALVSVFRAPAGSVQHHLNVGLDSRKTGEGQTSKINISSLVNEAHSDKPRSLKRKMEEMSTEVPAVDGGGEPLAQSAPNTKAAQQLQANAVTDTHTQQETQLPDAQSRDVLHPSEVSSLTHDSALEPIVSSTAPVIAQGVEAKEPARKKAKTSATTSKGIGKFVSGVCVGVVGALAAFIATIPASVREEALRELNNAT